MQIDYNNLYRKKAILPWYNSDIFCFLMSFIMALIFIFSLIGLFFAKEIPQYSDYKIVPIVLSILSAIMMSTYIARIIIRILNGK